MAPRTALALGAVLGCLMVAASEDLPKESRAVVIDVRPAELLASAARGELAFL